MNINFNDITYEKLRFLATREGKSVAAYVSQQMDIHTQDLIDIEFTIKDDDYEQCSPRDTRSCQL